MTKKLSNKSKKVFCELADEVNSLGLFGQQVEKFQENGLWGVKDLTGEIVLTPRYDQIEFCEDFVYAHYKQRHIFFYKNGESCDCRDRDDDYRFYENGKIGLKDCDGHIVFPAIYDEIGDWGKNCDVVYVRAGMEWHYFTHNHEEILTDVESFECDAYPRMPYCLGEDQERKVLLCVEPIDKKMGNRDCYAYNQWVRLSRIPCSQIRSIFESCDIVPFSTERIKHFEDKYTYIYSARMCSAKGKMPITQCFEKFKTLGVYHTSWSYMLKISVNRNTSINPYDLYNAIKHFQDMKNGGGYEFGVAYDDTLSDGEVRVLQVHYFWDDGGAFLDDEFTQEMIPNSPVEDIKRYVEGMPANEREDRLSGAILNVSYSKRDWKETESVLEYLNEKDPNCLCRLVWHALWFDYFWIEEVTPEEWTFNRNLLIWTKNHGANLNEIFEGKSMLDTLEYRVNEAKERSHKGTAARKSLKNAYSFLDLFKSFGPMTTSEIRKTIESKLEGLSPAEVFELVRTV